MAFDIPNKIIFKRKEVIGLTKLDGRVLDYWETEFGGINPVVNSAGDKSYTRKDVESILRIKQLLIIDRVDKKKIKDIMSGGAVEEEPKAVPKTKKKAAQKKSSPAPQKPAVDLSRIKSELKDILLLLEKRDSR